MNAVNAWLFIHLLLGIDSVYVIGDAGNFYKSFEFSFPGC